MLSDDHRRVLIAGGGIGGLSVALALAQSGVPVRVLEQADGFSEAGAGIQLGPNAMRVLRTLGVADRLAPHAVAPEGVHLYDAHAGECLATVSLGAMTEVRYGAPYWVVHRADLQSALLELARENDNIVVTHDFRVTRCSQDGAGVRAVAENGAEAAGGALIGADGWRSSVRASVAAEGAPVYSGKTAWRLVAPFDAAPSALRQNAVGLWMSPRAHMVHYPVRGSTQINVVTIVDDRDAPTGWNAPGEASALVRHLDGWPDTLTGFLAAHDGWLRWALYDMAPPRRWSSGRITLLGDAAHPILPFLASGGVLAIEDAAVLAREMAAAKGDAATAFLAYERKRRPRAAQVHARSRRMGRIYHMGGVMRWSRNQVLTARSPQELLARNDWLYGYRADDA